MQKERTTPGLLDKAEARCAAAAVTLLLVSWPVVVDLGFSPAETALTIFVLWLLAIAVLAADAGMRRGSGPKDTP